MSIDNKSENEALNIVIMGGNLSNLGAEAMVFTVVDEVMRIYGDNANFYLMSTTDIGKNKNNVYNFEILPWGISLGAKCIRPLNLLRKLGKSKENNVANVIEKADVILDISGFALSSQFRAYRSIKYIFNIMIAKHLKIKYYILPQSIGPFNYKFPINLLIIPLLKKYFKYPEIVYVREESGYKNIVDFRPNNLIKSLDLILHKKNENVNFVYTDEHLQLSNNINIDANSIAVIPNIMINKDEIDSLVKMYSKVIERIDDKRNIYLLPHSTSDQILCDKLKSCFINNDKVRLIKFSYDSLEINSILKQFDYVIASRYHSIIHSYKNSVPAIIIGWADKYVELAKNFSQDNYIFDARYDINFAEIQDAINLIEKNFRNESKTIEKHLSIVQENSIFEQIVSEMSK